LTIFQPGQKRKILGVPDGCLGTFTDGRKSTILFSFVVTRATVHGS
jgi:hypothetical protein